MAVKGFPLAAGAVGIILVWSGVQNQGITTTIQDLVQGKKPQPGPNAGGQIGPGGVAGAIAGTSGLGTQIAAQAISYIGKLGWCFAGSINSGCPDCSGFVNGVLGRDLGLAIPFFKAGTFDGSQHGPSSFMYPPWSGVVRIPRSAVSPGDLCVWMNPIGHIGIAVDNSTLVSDLNPSLGVKETPIDRTDTGILVCLRLKAVMGSDVQTLKRKVHHA